jgi:hypothetical protein
LPDDQGAVWFALEADNWVCREFTGISRAELVIARLQHLVSTTEDIASRDPIPGLIGALAPSDPLSSKLRFDCRAVDSTGIKAEGEGEWNARKHGGPKRRLWRKIHIGIDEETLEIRAVEVTSSSIGDAPMLPDLLDQIPPDEEIGSVTGDGAYDTRKCHDAIAARNAHAVIPPRKNAKLWRSNTPGARARNEAVRASKYLGRALWRQVTGYHRRSRVETTLSWFASKPLPGSGCIV